MMTDHFLSYADRLHADSAWAMSEAGSHFEERSSVHITLDRFAKGLNDLNVVFGVIGSMALYHHGYRRFTSDVDLLVNQDGLAVIQRSLDVLGCVRGSANGRRIVDVALGVPIDLHVSGDCPGDRKPKPVVFPEPTECVVVLNGLPVVTLPRLIELYLASGMTMPSRLKDLATVIETLKVLDVPHDFGDGLSPYVRDRFDEYKRAALAARLEDY